MGEGYTLTAKVQKFSGLLGRFEQALNEMKYGSAILGFVKDEDNKKCLVYERGESPNERIRTLELKEFVEDLQSFFPSSICRQSSFVVNVNYVF